VEPLSLDEAYLDVTENLKGIAFARQIAQEIRARIRQETGLTASAGVSYNKFLAKLASDQRKPDGLFIITPDMGAPFVEALPVGKFHDAARSRQPRRSQPICYDRAQAMPPTAYRRRHQPSPKVLAAAGASRRGQGTCCGSSARMGASPPIPSSRRQDGQQASQERMYIELFERNDAIVLQVLLIFTSTLWRVRSLRSWSR
jgi:hypothetical protein